MGSSDPSSYVVWDLDVPGRVTQGKQILGDGTDKVQLEKKTLRRVKNQRTVMSSGMAQPGPHLGARLGWSEGSGWA